MPEPHGKLEQRGLETTPKSPTAQGRFGRMFRKLLVVDPDDQLLKDLAKQMSETGGSQGGDNPDMPAGYTYLGQFVDHDITFDPTPLDSVTGQNDPQALKNFRTPAFDLDCLYGAGPKGSPFLYAKDAIKLKVGRNPPADDDGEELERDDLPRDQEGTALIGDPRNDENVIVSQLHLVMIRFHNRVVDRVASQQGLEGRDLFKEAQRVARWHYQWVVIHDLLERIVGTDLVDQLLRPNEDPPVKLKHYKPKKNPFMPVEFSVAAYRFGHSMIRPTYLINEVVPELPIFSGRRKPAPREDFHGFRRLPSFWTVDWTFFFDVGGAKSRQKARKIDTKLAEGLHNLPGERGDMASLPLRNLRRAKRLGLPSGQEVAEAVGATPLSNQQLGFDGPAPLWFYVLREAELKENGRQLGETGGRIVAEVFLGLLEGDPLSFLQKPTWTPDLPARKKGDFTMADLLEFAVPDLTKR